MSLAYRLTERGQSPASKQSEPVPAAGAVALAERVVTLAVAEKAGDAKRAIRETIEMESCIVIVRGDVSIP